MKYFHGFVGEKFIISINYKNLMQFSAQGKFIRTIATKGGGPEEFSQIDAWVVDENEHFLMYHDYKKKFIFKYNLNNGHIESKIPFDAHGYLSKMLSMNDTTYAFLPSMFSTYGYQYFFQSINGQILGGKKMNPRPSPKAWAGRSAIFVKSKDNSIIFQPSESDTIFRIYKTNMIPQLTIKGENSIKIGDKTTGDNVSFVHMDSERIYLRKTMYEKVISKNSSSIKHLEMDDYIFNKKSNTLMKISGIYYDHIGIKLNNSYINFNSYDHFTTQYSAINFKELLSNAIKENTLSKDKLNRLKKLDNEISENDNPILITGKLK